MVNISLIQAQKLPEVRWYQKELTHKVVGVALAVLGALGIALSVGMFMSGMPLAIGGGVFVLDGSLVTIALGINGFKKPCWEDPTYVAKQNEKAKGMTFEQIIKNYGTSSANLSKVLIAEKVVESLREGKNCYGSVDYEILRPLIKTEVESSRITIKSLFSSPIGRYYENESWFKKALEKEIRGKPFEEISRYIGIDKCVEKEILRQVEEIGFEAYYKKNNKILLYFLISKFSLLEPVKKAVENKSVKEIIDLYGWPIFRILDAREYRAQFEAEAANLTGEQIYNTYGNGLLQTGITTRKFLEEKIDSCQTIEQVFHVPPPVPHPELGERFSWNPTTH